MSHDRFPSLLSSLHAQARELPRGGVHGAARAVAAPSAALVQRIARRFRAQTHHHGGGQTQVEGRR